MPSFIIGIDPGKTTGLVVVTDINYQTCEYSIVGYKPLEWGRRSALLHLLTQYSTGGNSIDTIVMENFKLYPNKAMDQSYSEFPSVKIIERVTVYAELLNLADKIVLQMASQRTNVQIPKAHYEAIPNRHCLDAYQHIRYYIRVNRNKQSTT